ncbi:quinone oxidoreductase family protein [Crateriforma conspicua]|uniref:quinone oxidoreductase family protein n=1 Tax=Crateriforma conspicua TaxID=2527996 RepID=UPI001187A2E4|nr:zinc-binding dehydrogenase [Crateriforma conspicua]QDV62107.1 Crotonyl-CoA reductase [Crateriforma conspicua]
MMKALVLHQLQTPLTLQERPDLDPPADGVVVGLKAASLNRRDHWITQGMYPGIQLPVVLGSDASGVVIKTGARVGNYWQNRAVIVNPGQQWGDNAAFQADDFHITGMPSDGSFATQMVVPVSQLHEKPLHLDWRQASALPLSGVTAFRALFTQGKAEKGSRVLITGIGGGVASFALQFAVAAGAEAWVTSSSPLKIDQAVALGANAGFNYKDDAWPQRAIEDARQFDLIIDGAGGPGYANLLKVAAPGGTIVSYGATTGAPEKLDLFKVFWKQLRLQGSTMGSPEDFEKMIAFVERHQIVPVIDEVCPLEEGNLALERMQSSRQFGKIVLSMDPGVDATL